MLLGFLSLIKNKHGQGIVETVVAIGIFAIAATSVIYLLIGSLQTTKYGGNYSEAEQYLYQGWEAIKSIGYNDFGNLTESPTTYGVDDSSGEWVIAGTSNTSDIFTRTIEINNVYRDVSGDIAPTGTLDVHIREVIVTVTWNETPTRPASITSTFYITNWDSEDWFEDLVADFGDGTFYNTEVTNNDDGEVALEELAGGGDDWSCLEYLTLYNATGAGDTDTIDAQGNYVYLGRDNSGGDHLIIVDVTDPANPTLAGSLNVATSITDLKVSGDYAYISTIHNTQEIMIVDISTPSSLSIDYTYDTATGGNATGVHVENDRLYVTTESGGGDEFYLFDITTPLTPTLLDSYDGGSVSYNAVFVNTTDQVAYVGSSDDSGEVVALDLSTESAIALLDTLDLESTHNVDSIYGSADGDYLYVGRHVSGTFPELYTIDTSTPSSLSQLDSDEMGDDVHATLVSEDYLLLAMDDLGLFVMDISSPADPIYINDYTDVEDINDVTVLSGYVYAGTNGDTSYSNMLVFEPATGWVCPTLVSEYDQSGNTNPYDIFLVSDTAYIVRDSGTTNELEIVDVTDRENPSLLGSLNLGADANDIVVSGNYAYIATDGNELMVVDISVPSSLSIDGSYNAPGGANGESVWVSGDRVILGRASTGGDDIYLLDISTPTSPTYLDSYDTGATTYDLQVVGDYVYLATRHNTNTFENYNISTDSFVWEDFLQVSSGADIYGMWIEGDFAYLALDANASSNEFMIADISDPTNLAWRGSYEIGDEANNVWSDGSYAFVVTDDNSQEIMIFDVTDPDNPDLVSVYSMSGTASGDGNGITGDASYIYAVSEDNSTELVILQASTAVGSTAHEIVDDTQTEFDAGTYSDTQWDTDHVELTPTGITNGTGTYTSQIFDAGSSADWGSIEWVENLDTGSGLALEVGTINVAGTFTTVNLQNTYTDPVVIPFYYESANTEPISVRLDNLGTTSFDIALQAPNGSTPSTDTVEYLVIEKGSYTLPDGTLVEIGSFDTSTVASKTNGWVVGTNVNFSQSFSSAPVVLHQVQTNNDTDWISTFVSEQGNKNNPPSSTGFNGALNGAEATNSHGSETIGWVAWETGTGTIGGVSFEAQITGDNIRGHSNGCYTTNFSNSYATSPYVILSQLAMDGGDGGWGVGCSLSTTAVGSHIEEDTVGDPDRGHTTEQVNFLAFDSTFDWSIEHDIQFQVRSCNDAACSGESFIGPDGTSGTYYTNPAGETMNVSDNQYFQYQVTFTSADNLTSPELSSVTIDYSTGGGGGGGGDYEMTGTYESNNFDSGQTSNWNTIEWAEDLTGCTGCTLQLQIRTATTEAGLSSELWQGPDGIDADETDFYTNPEGSLIHPDHNGDRWFQYRASFTGDGTSTPFLEDINITYVNY